MRTSSALKASGVLLASLFTLNAASVASPDEPTPIGTSLPLPLRLVHQFALGTWVENLYVRSSGDILVTTYEPDAKVYMIANPSSPTPTVSLLHTFGSLTGVLGITETLPGLFAVLGGNFTSPGVAVKGSAAVWELDLRRPTPSARLLVAMPDAVFLNGVDNTPADPLTLLMSDATLGLVWRLDTRTGDHSVALQDPSMAIVAGAALPVGINGLRVHKNYLYWTNSFSATINRVRINGDGSPAHGATVEIVSHTAQPLPDDLFIGPQDQDIVWAATNLGNKLVAVRPGDDGRAIVVEGAVDQLTLAGDTACRFGRGLRDQNTLYVTTSGGLVQPVNGTATEGGKIVGIDTSSFVAAC